jgi:hypothetical protein
MLLAAVALGALFELSAARPATPVLRAALDLAWVAPASCSSRSEVDQEVARLLDSAEGARREVRARVVLTEAESDGSTSI